ncbi:MAG: DUF4838 domain-containing protein [Victivallales bacterium]|nr:DUF4838 domain-containing protein [Victivallales bacterium]
MLKKVLLATVMLCAAVHAELTLAKNGATDYVIVMPDKCHQSFPKEIEEFKGYLKQMTGAEFRVIKSAEWKEEMPAISVGDTAVARKAGIDSNAMKRDELVVKTFGKNLILAGFAMSGPCYAMYEFMERACGCRWYDSQFVVIPKHETLTIGDLDIRRAPSFPSRRVFTGGGGLFYESKHYLANAYKSSYLRVPNAPYGRPGDIHTFWLYAKAWPKDNIKLLSKNEKGKRRRLIGAIGPNFCLSNPECAERMTEQLKDFIRQDRRDAKAYGTPVPFIYNLTQNDADSYFCHCEECDAVVEQLGQSGLLLTFINKIARAIAKEYPDVVIQTAAYSFTRNPPKKPIEIEPNINVDLAHTVGNYYAPIEDDPACVECVNTWTSMCKSMAAWDYWIFYWDRFPAPYHNVHQIAKDIRFYYNNGFKFVRIESEDPAFANFFSLKVYLGYKMMYDVNSDENSIIDDFMKGYYGPAADEVREFMDYVAERQKGQNVCVFGKNKEKYTPDRPWLDSAFFARCEDIFNRAEAKCEAGSRYLINVHRERIPVDIALLNLYDAVKPSVARETLIERHTAHRKEQIELRVQPQAKGEMLLKLEKEMEVFRNAVAIAKLKAAPKPHVDVPSAPEWSKPVVWFTNSGCPSDRKLSLAMCKDGDNLRIVLKEDGLRSAPKVGANIWDGDDWEVMLAENRSLPYFQILVDPKGKSLALLVEDKGNAKQNIEGLAVKCDLTAQSWTAEITLPLNNLPIKNIRYGNFFRASQMTHNAWSPTFESLFGDTSAFGEILIK